MCGLIDHEGKQRSRHYLKSAAECTSKAVVSLELAEQLIFTEKDAKKLEGVSDQLKCASYLIQSNRSLEELMAIFYLSHRSLFWSFDSSQLINVNQLIRTYKFQVIYIKWYIIYIHATCNTFVIHNFTQKCLFTIYYQNNKGFHIKIWRSVKGFIVCSCVHVMCMVISDYEVIYIHTYI